MVLAELRPELTHPALPVLPPRPERSNTTMTTTEAPCPHCPDGHKRPDHQPWAAWVTEARDGDRQPTTIHISRSDGSHVAESDAEWIRDVLNGRACSAHETCAECEEPFTPEPGNLTGFCSWACFDVKPRPNAPEAFRVLALGADTPMVRAIDTEKAANHA
jgi:hypothetical protein